MTCYGTALEISVHIYSKKGWMAKEAEIDEEDAGAVIWQTGLEGC